MKYLAAASRRGDACDAAELDDLGVVLGARPASVAAGRDALWEAVDDGRVELADAVLVTYRRVARDNELLRGASGVLADRHHESLVAAEP